MPRLHSGAAIDTREITKRPPLPEVALQQPQETHLIDINFYSTIIIKSKNDVDSQTSPLRETSPQVSGSDTESLLGNQTRSTSVQCPSDSKKQQHEIHRNGTDMTTYAIGEVNSSRPKFTTSQIEERLMRDDFTNELYMPLSSTIVLKRKKKLLDVPLDLKNGSKIDALVALRSYVSAIAQKKLNNNKQQAPYSILIVDDPPNFQIQVAIGQFEKPIATVNLIFAIISLQNIPS